MARRKVKSRKSKSAKSRVKRTPWLQTEAAKEVAAIVLVALALLLLLATFSVGGSLVNTLFHDVRLGIGYSAYLLSIIFLLLAWMLFQPEKYDVRAHNYIGFSGIILALCGLLHIYPGAAGALSLAQNGEGGGYLGYAFSRWLLQFINTPAAATVLLALLFVSMVVAANAKLSDMIRLLFGKLHRGPREEIQINEPVAVANKLEVRGALNVGNAAKAGKDEADGALTVASDPDWTAPSLELLDSATGKPDAGNVKENAATIQQTLQNFGINVAMGEVNVGPTVTQYTLKPESGVKLTKITGLEHNLALSLAASSIRIEAPIPGKSAVGVEIPNQASAIVRLRELLSSDEMSGNKSPLAFVLGRDVSGAPVVADLARMPHMLIAGATGSGKSIMINTFINTLLYRNSPSALKLILVDPKRVELSLYNDVPHLLSPVIVDPKECISALKWATAEMERRLKLFAEVGNRNINEYNAANQEESMPFIVIVIDEMADLMMIAAGDVEALIVRLAQLARAVGIHLVLATQRPSVDVITGLIKANIPARIAFTVASQVDSRTIIDQAGAEKLVGKGDMLFSSPEYMKPKRIQGVYMDEKEIKKVTDFLRSERAPQYNEEVLTQKVSMGGGRGGDGDYGEPDDNLFNEAADTVIRSGKASASLLQRRLRVGYARAARLLDLLEERGIVGPADGARPRDVLVSSLTEVGAESVDDYEG